jgi:hypothetical protein
VAPLSIRIVLNTSVFARVVSDDTTVMGPTPCTGVAVPFTFIHTCPKSTRYHHCPLVVFVGFDPEKVPTYVAGVIPPPAPPNP